MRFRTNQADEIEGERQHLGGFDRLNALPGLLGQ
jgi:hypothetical protein